MPLATGTGSIAKAAESSGADALMVANTYPGMAIDVRAKRSRQRNFTGGQFGPTVKPVTLQQVWLARKAVEIPIVGLGGVVAA